jgi:hypothetical protein
MGAPFALGERLGLLDPCTATNLTPTRPKRARLSSLDYLRQSPRLSAPRLGLRPSLGLLENEPELFLEFGEFVLGEWPASLPRT